MDSRGRRAASRFKLDASVAEDPEEESQSEAWSDGGESDSLSSSEKASSVGSSESEAELMSDGNPYQSSQLQVANENARYFSKLDIDVDDSDQSIDDDDLEDLMFGLTEANKPGRKSKRRTRRRRPLFSSSRPARSHRASAVKSARSLSVKATQLLQEANNAYLEADYKLALNKAIAVIRESPGAHDPFHLMGLIYETAYGDPRRAINAYLVAASILKSDIDLWKRIGQMAERLEVDSLAIYCYRRVLPPSRQRGAIDEDVAVDIAKLFIKRCDFPRAAVYLQKVYVRHLGDPFLAVELAKCFLRIPSMRSAAVILESCLAASLPLPVRDSLCVQVKDHEWLEDPSKFEDDEESLMLLSAYADYFDETSAETFPEPTALLPINWEGCELLFSLLIELGEPARCANLGGKVLVQAQINETQEQDPQRIWTDPNLYHEAIKAMLDTAPIGVAVKVVSAAIRSGVESVDWMADLVLSRLDCLSKDHTSPYYIELADAYFIASDPLRALSIYKCIAPETSEMRKGEFWLKAAKCYIKLKQYDRAADFLEQLAPTTLANRPGLCNSMNEIISRVRAVEARLLLRQIFNGEHVSENKEDEATKEFTSDKRIRHLIIGSSMSEVPKSGLAESVRRLIILRVAVHSDLIEKATLEIGCCSSIAEWIERHRCDALPPPSIPQQIINLYLQAHLRPLLQGAFTVSDIWSGLADADLAVAPERVAAGTEPDAAGASCRACGLRECSIRRRRFISSWRLLICSEYIVLMRDSAMDMRRVLQESSRHRAAQLTKHLKVSKNMASTPTPLSALENDRTGDKTPQAESNDIEERLLIRTKPKGMAGLMKRRQQLLEKGLPHSQLLLHARIRSQLKVVVLEDILNWDDYTRLLELGTILLVKEGLPALAVELLECTILSIRYSRTLKNFEYASQRQQFKVRVRRLIMRTAVMHDLIRITLSHLRGRLLTPSSWTDLPNTRPVYEKALSIYGSFLFSGVFAHHCLTSIAASTSRDIVSFNRAWIIKRLLEKPQHFQLILFAGHFCILSTRYVYAVAEYTRALNLKPQSCVASLCLAVATIGFSTSRGVQDRHHVALRGFSALHRYFRVREAWCSTLQRKVATFALQKVSQIITENANHSQFWSRLGLIVEAPDAERETIIQLLSIRVTGWVKWYCGLIEECVACERIYNEARAYHHLNLVHLAAPLYAEVMSRLSKISVPESYTDLAMLILRIPRGSFSLTAMVKLSQSVFPPAVDYALCNNHDEICKRVWYCRHAENRIGTLQLPLNCEGLDSLLLAQVAGQEEANLAEVISFEKLNWDSAELDLASHIILPGHLIEPDPMAGDLNDLAGIFLARAPLDVPKIRSAVNSALQKYMRDLPPGLFLLTVDRRQLLQCAVFNASQIARSVLNYTYARHTQAVDICW